MEKQFESDGHILSMILSMIFQEIMGKPFGKWRMNGNIMRKMTGEKSWTSIWTAMIRGQVKMWLWTNLGYPKIWRLRQTSLKSTSVFCQRNGENHHLNHHHLLVGGWPTPLKNHGVKVTWDHEIPNFSWKVIQNSMVPTFQSPPTRYKLNHHNLWSMDFPMGTN